MAILVKNLPAMWETWVQSLGWEDPLEKGMGTHSSIPAWESQGQRSLVGCSPRGRKESDTTEWPPLSLWAFPKTPCSQMNKTNFLGKRVPTVLSLRKICVNAMATPLGHTCLGSHSCLTYWKFLNPCKPVSPLVTGNTKRPPHTASRGWNTIICLNQMSL